MKKFYNLLLNTVLANVTVLFLWFALVYWVYLETRMVIVTAILGGAYMLFVAFSSMAFGTIVDKHPKQKVMRWSSMVTLVLFMVSALVFCSFDHRALTNPASLAFWLFSIPALAGAVMVNARNLALVSSVAFLVEEKRRDRANGLLGSAQGLGMMATNIFSGLAIGRLGMGNTILISLFLMTVTLIHLKLIEIPEPPLKHDPHLAHKKIDFASALKTIKSVPGLMMLLFFTTFNNLIGGIFMALIDPYGLTLFSVEMWGIVSGLSFAGFILGGILVAKRGLGKNPLKLMLLASSAIALIGVFYTIREWAWLFVAGMFTYMTLFPVVEAAEQTIIQKVVPQTKQGRVFGFAQTLEAAASPVSAFLIGPLAQFWLIPYMATPQGQARFSWLLGTGSARGIALTFLLASLVTFFITLLAFKSKAYKELSGYYLKA